jgi:hypothetical protein
MPITRTIYTQGAASVSGWPFNRVFLSGIQSANVSISTPRQDVNAFGVLGSINKVQLEPVEASADISLYITDANSGVIPFLISNSQNQTPNYIDVSISGLGIIKNAILSSFSFNAAVGDIPTISMTFNGQSGQNLSAGVAPTTPNTQTLTIQVPQTISGIMFSGGSTCAQSIELSYEMPTEKINCLGNPINDSTLFPVFPGTLSVEVNGTEAPYLVTGVQIGNLLLNFPKALEVSRSHNMAIGDTNASYNLTQETTALDLGVYEAFNVSFNDNGDNGASVVYAVSIINVPKGQAVKIWFSYFNDNISVSEIEFKIVATDVDNNDTTIYSIWVTPNDSSILSEGSAIDFTPTKDCKIRLILTTDSALGDYFWQTTTNVKSV